MPTTPDFFAAYRNHPGGSGERELADGEWTNHRDDRQ